MFGIIPNMKHAVFFLAIVLAVVGCRRTDVRDFTISIPDMTAADAQASAAALAPYAGVDKASLKFDPAAKTLFLRYDSMQLAKKNIEISIAQAGFTANGVTPESVGSRPKGK